MPNASREIIVSNKLGLHARPAMQFVDLPTGDINLARYIEMLVNIGYPQRYCQFMGTKTAPLIVEAESAAVLLNRRVQRDDHVATTVLPPRQAHVAHHDDQPATGNKCAEAVSPDLVELSEEGVVVFDVPQLALALAVLLQRPVRRRRYGEVNRLGLQKVEPP